MTEELDFYQDPPSGIPEVISTQKHLKNALAQLQEASGALAIDSERASGYTYTQKAYLIQIKKADTSAFLIDPTINLDFEPLKEIINDSEWILHAATQDLPCLYEFDLKPKKIFDTEVAARLLALPRVSLLGLLEDRLKISIEKAHSAVNWSTRPLKREWLSYAALDVEFLHLLQNDLTKQLIEQDLLNAAEVVFTDLLSFKPNPPRIEAWRGTSGIHQLTNNQQAAIVRALWIARDQHAKQLNLAPHRIFRDEKIIKVALSKPQSKVAFEKIFKKLDSEILSSCYNAYQIALELAATQWPQRRAGVRLPKADPGE